MHGQPKMVVAKDILQDVSYWFPEDLDLALRAYGSTSPSDSNDCGDSMLLVPFGDENREPIRRAIAGLRPLGQTPIAYALNQASRDFGAMEADRAVVLVTDGIESCDGDAVAAAQAFQEPGRHRPIHVIGFGIEAGHEEAEAKEREEGEKGDLHGANPARSRGPTARCTASASRPEAQPSARRSWTWPALDPPSAMNSAPVQ